MTSWLLTVADFGGLLCTDPFWLRCPLGIRFARQFKQEQATLETASVTPTQV